MATADRTGHIYEGVAHVGALAHVLRSQGLQFDPQTLLEGMGAMIPDTQQPVEAASMALNFGLAATLYTWNLGVFDPRWFDGGLIEAIEQEMRWLDADHLTFALLDRHIDLIERGGYVLSGDPSEALLLRHLGKGRSPIVWVSPDYLWVEHPRLMSDAVVVDSLDSVGHTVALIPGGHSPAVVVRVPLTRLVGAMLLGAARAMVVLEAPR